MTEPMSREKVEWLGTVHPPRPGSTHYVGCAETHIQCALQALIDNDAALRATIQQQAEQIERLTAERGEAEQREQRLREAVQGLLDIGKRDLTNPKYDGYFESLREALDLSPSPQGGDAPNRER